jgi:hypothetical protein
MVLRSQTSLDVVPACVQRCVEPREAGRLDWLLLAALGIMWVAFLMPIEHRRHSPHVSIGHFERRMELLAQVETQATSGRWIVTPRKGTRFLGHTQRKRARARERRRHVFVFLLESIGITFLIGLVPPLRVFWQISLALGVLLLLYVWLLMWIKRGGQSGLHPAGVRDRGAGQLAHVGYAPGALYSRHVAGPSQVARATFNGLSSAGEADHVHVVVRRADSLVHA